MAKKAEQNTNVEDKQTTAQSKEEDMNWFGVKLKMDNPDIGPNSSHGVGKYINVKRARDAPTVGDENDPDNAQKKRKMGFGNFDSW